MNRLLQFQFALVAAALLLLLVVALFPGKPRIVQLRFDETVAALENVQDQEAQAQRLQRSDRRAQQADRAAKPEPAQDAEAPPAAIEEPAPAADSSGAETRFSQDDVAKPSPTKSRVTTSGNLPPEVAARLGLGGNTGAPASETAYR
jgi:hypothetical protein